MSKKALKILAARSLIRKRLVAERGERCESCGRTGALHMHERFHRGRGGSAVEESNIILLCPTCHANAHAHPREAEARGLSERRWPRG